MSNDLELANRAIGLCGGEPITDFNGDTPLSDFASIEWPDSKAWLLGSYRWTFAEAFARLTQIAVAPEGCPLTFAFERPADLGGAIHAARNGPDQRIDQLIATVQTADYLAADTTPVWIEYTRSVEVAAWPSWATELLVKFFASKVGPRVHRRDLAQAYDLECFGPPEMNRQGGLWLDAVQKDSRNAPARSLQYADGGALSAARFGFGVGLAGGPGPGWPNNGFPVQVVIGS